MAAFRKHRFGYVIKRVLNRFTFMLGKGIRDQFRHGAMPRQIPRNIMREKNLGHNARYSATSQDAVGTIPKCGRIAKKAFESGLRGGFRRGKAADSQFDGFIPRATDTRAIRLYPPPSKNENVAVSHPLVTEFDPRLRDMLVAVQITAQ